MHIHNLRSHITAHLSSFTKRFLSSSCFWYLFIYLVQILKPKVVVLLCILFKLIKLRVSTPFVNILQYLWNSFHISAKRKKHHFYPNTAISFSKCNHYISGRSFAVAYQVCFPDKKLLLKKNAESFLPWYSFVCINIMK